jgi:hypothetical protein
MEVEEEMDERARLRLKSCSQVRLESHEFDGDSCYSTTLLRVIKLKSVICL